MAVLSAVFALAGCGGGFYLAYDNRDDIRDDGGVIGSGDGRPPQVELVVGSSTAQVGQNVRLAAAAVDGDGIDEVIFYRYDGNTAVRLGNDRSAPYEFVLPVPNDGRASVSVFARAYDERGQSADSAIVTLAIVL